MEIINEARRVLDLLVLQPDALLFLDGIIAVELNANI
jgi:hypothetical protein